MRELVHEPMKILSTAISVIGVLGASPMYFNARSIASRFCGSFSRSGSGTRSSIETTISGDVPHVTWGLSFVVSISTTLSNFAPGSDTSVRQYAAAFSNISPCGAKGRPRR